MEETINGADLFGNPRLAVSSQGGNAGLAHFERMWFRKERSLSPPPKVGKMDPSTWGNSVQYWNKKEEGVV